MCAVLLHTIYATPGLTQLLWSDRYMHRGSLFKVLRKRGGVPLDPKLQRSVATSVARGMAHLHSRSPPILHLVHGLAFETPRWQARGWVWAFIAVVLRRRLVGFGNAGHAASISFAEAPGRLPIMRVVMMQDLKSPNILVDSQWRIKIGGLSSPCCRRRWILHFAFCINDNPCVCQSRDRAHRAAVVLQTLGSAGC